MAHIVVLMGSPRRDGNTARLTRAFLDGLSPRVTTDLLVPAQMNLKPCQGCNACFHTPDNRCVQKDDMAQCYERLSQADVIVIATPLYFYSVSAQLKILIDRLHNPIRNGFRVKKLVLLAVGGNPDPGIFDPLIAMYGRVCRYFALEDGGILTIPGVRGREDLVDHPALERARQLAAGLDL